MEIEKNILIPESPKERKKDPIGEAVTKMKEGDSVLLEGKRELSRLYSRMRANGKKIVSRKTGSKIRAWYVGSEEESSKPKQDQLEGSDEQLIKRFLAFLRSH